MRMGVLPDDLATVNEAADYLKVHPETVRRMIHRGELEAAKVGQQGREYRIPVTELRRVLVGSVSGTTSRFMASDRVDSSGTDQKRQKQVKPWGKNWKDRYL